MEFLFLYSLFALTTGIAAVYEIMQPVMSFRTSEGFNIEDRYIMYFVFFILTIILAPAVFFSCYQPVHPDYQDLFSYFAGFTKCFCRN